jgi:hypothetical protein
MLQAGSLGSVEATDIFLLRHENKIMWVQVYCTIGSSDFPRSLCFMWFWFGLEILRLLYKKVVLKYWTTSILFDLLNSKKIALSLLRVKKKFFKIGRKGYQKKRNFALIPRMCRTLGSRSFKRSPWKISFSVKINFLLLNSRLLHTFDISVKSCFFRYPLRTILKKFLFQLLYVHQLFISPKGGPTF